LNSPDTGRGRRKPIVLCAGIAVEDFLFKVERFPEPGAKVPAEVLTVTAGGCAANAAIAVSRLGGIARFSGPVGTDDASQRFLASLAQDGVDVSGVTRVEGGSISVSGIFIDRDGEKMVVTRRGERLDRALPADPAALVADIDVLLVDNRFPDYVRPICRSARTLGTPVVLDVDKATQPTDPLLATATHLIFSSEALRATTGEADLGTGLRAIAASVRGFVAVTDGPGDVLWVDGGLMRRMPVFTITAVDTLGAGDVFHAGFALGLAEGSGERSAMRLGAAAAALKCRHFGGISGAPRRDDVDALLPEDVGLKQK
jgi:sulfofructose kinase